MYFGIETKNIYLITTEDNEKYILCSIEDKRRVYERAVSNNYKALVGKKIKSVEFLENTRKYKERRRELIYRHNCKLNKISPKKVTRTYKGGIEYNGVWFPSLRKLWELHGEVPFGTFKSRYYKLNKPLSECLK